MIQRHAAVAFPDAASKLPRPPETRTSYIPCPECAGLMNRKNFGGTSGVVVDVCKKHGTWFDLGELPRVLAFVAAGIYDAFWEFDLAPWDVAAGALLIAEAGGRVGAIEGGPFTVGGRSILASNGAIHAEMERLLAAA